MMRVTRAQLIRYMPQYLVVEIVGDASDQDDLDEINRSTWDIVDATLGWEPYNAIIRVSSVCGMTSYTYLALVAD
jgi:hypothetical protein